MSDVSRLLNEHVIPIDAASFHLHGTPSRPTLNRYMRSGQLESFLCGGRRFTTSEACERFIARCNAKECCAVT